MKQNKLSLQTREVHAGEPSPRVGGAVTMPIFQTSTYQSSREAGYHDIPYLRLNNSPNHLALHRKLASLENTEAALVTASGMAAITTALFSSLNCGDHLLAQRGLYGGTHTFLTQDLPRFGIEFDFVDLQDSEDWQQKLKRNTRAFYVETLTNPLIEVGDLEGVVEFAKAHQLITLIDNTLASPVNCRPVELGYDLVLHSATKYLNGHSDIVGGVIAGAEDRVHGCKIKLDHLGGTLDPHACFLLHRGIKTLSLRMAQQNRNALALAKMLAQHPAVATTYYPGLSDHRDATRAARLFSGCGGLLSFDHRDGADGAHGMIDRLEIAIEAVSLGGVETLVTLPAESTHAGVSAEQRAVAGIGDGLVRVAVGVEGTEDLLADFRSALDG